MDAAPTAEVPAECVTDKGYHSRSVLKAPTAPGNIEPKQKGFARWHGDGAARRAVKHGCYQLRAEIVDAPLRTTSGGM